MKSFLYKSFQNGQERRYYYDRELEQFEIQQIDYDNHMEPLVEDIVNFPFDELIQVLARVEMIARNKS